MSDAMSECGEGARTRSSCCGSETQQVEATPCCGSEARQAVAAPCCGSDAQPARTVRCCGPELDEEAVKELVRHEYGGIAVGARQGCGCDGRPEDIARRIGYDPGDLEQVPEGANLGLGCGNPTAIAGLQPGEVVLDLGSGAGLDCFLAARRVGPTGKVIGVDMTPEMVARARANARQGGYDNVEFRLGEIEALPVADNSVDVVISNCVLNLVPDKARAFREIARVLKPGGRMMVSDMVLMRPLPDWVRESPGAYTGCVAGAVLKEEYLRLMADAGLTDVEVIEERDASDAFVDPTDPCLNRLIAGRSVEDIRGLVASINVRATKPRSPQ